MNMRRIVLVSEKDFYYDSIKSCDFRHLYSSPNFILSFKQMQSNIKLSANEFTDMIAAQCGFQGNLKSITVSEEMLEMLINMKR